MHIEFPHGGRHHLRQRVCVYRGEQDFGCRPPYTPGQMIIERSRLFTDAKSVS